MLQGEILCLSLIPVGGRAFLSLWQTQTHTPHHPSLLVSPKGRKKKKHIQQGSGLPGDGLGMPWLEQKYGAERTKTIPLD